MSVPVLVTADDRTGALEVGGALADLGFAVRLAEVPDGRDDCLVLDIASRHVEAEEAGRRVVAAHSHPAQHRCHKMDSGCAAIGRMRCRRLCKWGIGWGCWRAIPMRGGFAGTARCMCMACLSRKGRWGVIRAIRCLRVVPKTTSRGRAARKRWRRATWWFWMPKTTRNCTPRRGAAMRSRASRWAPPGHLRPTRPSFAIGLVAGLPSCRGPRSSVCGSLHPLSREQVAHLPAPQFDLAAIGLAERELRQGNDVVLATANEPGPMDSAVAEAMASTVAAQVHELLAHGVVGTLIILGGDTAGAILGRRPMHVEGCVVTGVPVSCLRTATFASSPRAAASATKTRSAASLCRGASSPQRTDTVPLPSLGPCVASFPRPSDVSPWRWPALDPKERLIGAREGRMPSLHVLSASAGSVCACLNSA